jgi:hypothetical protein
MKDILARFRCNYHPISQSDGPRRLNNLIVVKGT